ncbi:hypothetical protein IQ273_30855 [Nodosilinea sp. LEGE 07298]|uniref:hypothetical protein n=1 Tax=Nodosilinea sp. LEGE 07298 TaxID=2777970 RepID=UPI0018813255|nr:hypothetical protein [Nodosilinea sp. LEGE 07298]MBE9113774.1 hypothetical protein [Nodosilinea sp. LEGE 07298]
MMLRLMHLATGLSDGRVDTQDPLIDQAAENDIYILAALLFVVVVLTIGIFSRRVGHLLLFSLSLCAVLICLVMALLL